MRPTAQEEYGLRFVVDIARTSSGLLTIVEIAKEEALSIPHVAKLMRILHKKGIVESVRGHRGGYRLSSPPDRLSVGTVLNALGERFYSKAFCSRYTGQQCTCVRDEDCSIRVLWETIDTLMQRVLNSVMVSDLLVRERPMESWMKVHVLSVQNREC